MTSHHVIIADDHPLFRDALKQTLGSALPGAAITEVGSVEKLLETLTQNANADLVLLDLKMPGEKGAASLSGLTGLQGKKAPPPSRG
jgi:DNA-binding NarL/FixJ family response regulator